MSETFRYEIVSPERLLKDAQTAMVVVPGAEGDFAVLPAHAPLMSTIRPGVVEIFESEGAAPEKFFLKGGLAQVSPQGLTILAEETLALGDVDTAKLMADLEKARSAVAAAKDDIERAAAEKEETWILALKEIVDAA